MLFSVFNFLIGILPVLLVSGGCLLLRARFGHKTKGDKYREVVGAYRRQSFQRNYLKIGGMKQVVEWPAQEPMFGIEGIKEAASLAGIGHAADLLKKPCSARPCHIVEVAKDQCRRLAGF